MKQQASASGRASDCSRRRMETSRVRLPGTRWLRWESVSQPASQQAGSQKETRKLGTQLSREPAPRRSVCVHTQLTLWASPLVSTRSPAVGTRTLVDADQLALLTDRAWEHPAGFRALAVPRTVQYRLTAMEPSTLLFLISPASLTDHCSPDESLLTTNTSPDTSTSSFFSRDFHYAFKRWRNLIAENHSGKNHRKS